jgi:hypothetical protein
MIILDATTKSFQVLLAGSSTTFHLPVTTYYVDMTTSLFVPYSTITFTNGTTPVTLVSAPSSGHQREVRMVSIQNADSAAATVTLRILDTATPYTICKITLAVGDNLTYTHGEGFKVIDSTGSLKQISGSVSLTSGVTGILPVANGGTGMAFFTPSGPASTAKTYTFPNANCTVLTSNDLVTAAQGGTANGYFQVSGPATSAKTFTFPNASDTVACLGQQNLYTKQQNFQQATLSISAGAVAWDVSTAQTAILTLTGNATMSACSNQVAGGTYVIIVKQDGTGSRTLAWNANYKFPGGTDPVITATASSVDVISFYSDGTYLYGVFSQAFA